MNPQIGFLLNKSLECLRGSNLESAELYLKQALRFQSNNPDILRLLGVIYAQRKQYSEALKYITDSLKAFPKNALALSNLGNIFLQIKEFDKALEAYDKSIKIDPKYEEAWSNKGNALYQLKRYDEASSNYDKAISLSPNYAEAWSNKGNVLHQLKRYDEAIAHHNKAISLSPNYAEAWSNKGLALYETGRIMDARMCFEKALELKPNFYIAIWAKLFTSIPIIPLGNENLQELRKIFSLELEELYELLLEDNFDWSHEIVGATYPFYLAYQELNNKELLSKYGLICNRLINNSTNFSKFHNTIKKTKGKIKVGIVGEQIHNHSVWNAITKGIVSNLDTNKFEIHIFHLGNTIDEDTKSAKLTAATFTNNQASFLDWIKAIFEKDTDVLLYPEIGMDSLTLQLACLRLAPIQIACWGHPETTGLPTIDYYLSAELFEDESSQEFYTETLVKLPNLGCSYSKPPITVTKFDFEHLEIRLDQPILICPGVPFKYAPKNDWIFVEITKRLGRCKLIFFIHENNNLSEILRARLANVFKEAHLIFDDYVTFIPWLGPEDFHGLMRCADLFLDTIGFSGFNTAMQAVDCALPIVTQKGRFMRGRFATGILERMGMSELIASDDKQYIELAVKLVQNRPYRSQVVKKIIETRDILYDDTKVIRSFEEFLSSKFIHTIEV